MRTVVQLSDSASRRGGGMFESIRGLCRGLEETRAWQPSMVALRDAFSVEDAAAWGATSLRFALALFLYTGQRSSDVVQFGPLTVRGGRLVFVQHKGRGRKPRRMSIPLIEPLRHILDASTLGKVTWLETEYGQPWSIASFGARMRQWCDEAGLQGLSAHGIRKATGILAAERGATAHEIMAILGHSTLEEAERYTREANTAKLADSGLAKAFGDEG